MTFFKIMNPLNLRGGGDEKLWSYIIHDIHIVDGCFLVCLLCWFCLLDANSDDSMQCNSLNSNARIQIWPFCSTTPKSKCKQKCQQKSIYRRIEISPKHKIRIWITFGTWYLARVPWILIFSDIVSSSGVKSRIDILLFEEFGVSEPIDIVSRNLLSRGLLWERMK